MAEQLPNPQVNEEEPFIPPHYLLLLALVGLLVAFITFFTQPTFSVVGWGGLGIMLLSLLAWVLMAPQQARAALTGRTVRFGGTSLLVTTVVIVALIALYTLIRSLEIRVDLTERDTFSLTTESRQAIAGIGADPSFGPVQILAFYGPQQASNRDRDQLLFEDYQTTSGGKITYEFIDPDRNPTLAQQYGLTSAGQLVVLRQNEAGEPDVDNAELVAFLSQDNLTNAILRVAAAGDFRAYFLNVDGGLELTGTGPNGMNTLNAQLTQRFGLTTDQVSLLELMAPNSEIQLNDPAADGEVLVIPGGSTALSADELAFIQEYLDNGGNLLIFAGVNLEGNTALATDENLSNYLYERFGLQFADSYVLDTVQALQTIENPFVTTFSTTHPVTRSFGANGALVFSLPHPIIIAPTQPENVTVTELASTSENSYSKSDIAGLLSGENIEPTDADPEGPFVVGAAAENSATGARVVLFGSSILPTESTAEMNGVLNLSAAFNSLVWLSDFEEYFASVTMQSAPRPQDEALIADQQTVSFINLLTIFLLPFGILAMGALVWWNSRETAQ